MEGVQTLIEDMLGACLPHICSPFPRLTFKEAFHNYGTDQPDLSIAPKIADLDLGLSGASIRTITLPNAANLLKNELRGDLHKLSRRYPGVRLATLKYPGSDWEKQLGKLFTTEISIDTVLSEIQPKIGDLVIIAVGEYKDATALLGKIRIETVKWLRNEGIIDGGWEDSTAAKFVWITEFPLVEDVDGTLKSAHHPFTAPFPSDWEKYRSGGDIRDVRGMSYDLVMNGWEIGGGSVRIHDSSLQVEILNEILGIPLESLTHMIKALASGAPPHAGIAIGLDRLVSILTGGKTIRDVIAFPKTSEGRDPLSGAPSSLSQDELDLYHVQPKIINQTLLKNQ